MNRWVHELRLYLIALQFFTRVPVPAWVGYTPAWMHASARHYPGVGLLVGLWGAAVLAAASLVWPATVAVGLSMAATVWLTGGFHEDGLADTCDGLGGAVTRERALLIMKDSRLGSYGALGLLLVLGLKAATLHALVVAGLAQALLAGVWAHAASRAVPVLLLALLPYAGDAEHAKAKPMAQQVSRGGLVAALAWVAVLTALAATLGAGGLALAAALGALACVTWTCRGWYRRRLGGYTGDTLGAAQQVGELAALLGWLAAAGWT
ncbi:adenosylcobinamide-GDP ribazoletransferase [Leptothrix discophora]|uniref:Adenosylcobinamide-GDP ribazoletransferase n=1 Tax=Leptothrix discophora TaxID=89 RepID=A0ABT9G280_LEPDI|nr:adenosylcobinamide-GDP ribazoletransferase [Leptothrix discophora]MDP4300592.1 adenosylcobinamide-GDP ribazoletransferase [Leptothrix discophora]